MKFHCVTLCWVLSSLCVAMGRRNMVPLKLKLRLPELHECWLKDTHCWHLSVSPGCFFLPSKRSVVSCWFSAKPAKCHRETWFTSANSDIDQAAEIMGGSGFFGLVEKETNPSKKNKFFLDELNQLVLWSVSKSNLNWREGGKKNPLLSFFFFCNQLS